MSKLIGILAEEEIPTSSAFNALKYYTNQYYPNAIAECGGIPILLMRSKTTIEIIKHLDGIVCQGGVDVDPSFYGEDKSELCKETFPQEDSFQLEMIKEACKCGIKILGICRGCQLINVAFQGTLYQDLSEFTTFNHTHTEDITKAFHKVNIEKNTLLSSLFNKTSIEVNSFHHQGVKKLAPSLIVSARAEDGCIEAIEGENILAVQWHPEALRESDKSMDVLFNWICN